MVIFNDILVLLKLLSNDTPVFDKISSTKEVAGPSFFTNNILSGWVKFMNSPVPSLLIFTLKYTIGYYGSGSGSSFAVAGSPCSGSDALWPSIIVVTFTEPAFISVLKLAFCRP